eukprot:scaffold57357_cov30-Phaeocystis_antarctica.AAC.2
MEKPVTLAPPQNQSAATAVALCESDATPSTTSQGACERAASTPNSASPPLQAVQRIATCSQHRMSHSARRKAAQPRSARLIPSSLGSALCSPSKMIEVKTTTVTTSWTPPAAQWSSRSSNSSSMRTLRLVLASSCVLTRRRTAGRKFSRSLRFMSSADSTEEPPFEVECPKERRKLAEPATAFT